MHAARMLTGNSARGGHQVDRRTTVAIGALKQMGRARGMLLQGRVKETRSAKQKPGSVSRPPGEVKTARRGCSPLLAVGRLKSGPESSKSELDQFRLKIQMMRLSSSFFRRVAYVLGRSWSQQSNREV